MALGGPFNPDDFGNPNKSAPAWQREYGTLSTSTVDIAGTGTVDIALSSAGEEIYVWGLIAVTNNSSPLGVMLEDSDGTDLIPAVATQEGPFFQNLDHPIKIEEGKNAVINTLVAGAGTRKVTVLYYRG